VTPFCRIRDYGSISLRAGHKRCAIPEKGTFRLTGLPAVAYAPRDDSLDPHLVGLAPRAERERRLLR